MTVYRKVINDLDLNNSSQSDWGWFHAICVLGDLYDDSADVLTNNPPSELIRKLETVAGVNPHIIARIKSLLSTLELQYSEGKRR